MVKEEGLTEQTQQFLPDINTSVRNIEEKQRILKDRIILIGQSLVDERDKMFSQIQEIKSEIIKLQEENKRIKQIIQNLSEKSADTPRKEELLILQRQFDIFRKQ